MNKVISSLKRIGDLAVVVFGELLSIAVCAFFLSVFLSVPPISWFISFVTGATFGGLRSIKWPWKVAILLAWGPLTLAFGYFFWIDFRSFAVFNTGICLVIFTASFLLSLHYCRRR